MKPLLSLPALALLAWLAAAPPTPAAEGKKSDPYPFALAPDKALAAMTKLTKLSGNRRAVNSAEKALLADVRGGHFGKYTLPEAALIADGVTDKAERAPLMEKYRAIRQGAKKALANVKGDEAKAKKLLRFLHAGPMKGGYAAGQTKLSVILRTGKFNCVSSAVLFNALASDLGMTVDAVRKPNHVYSRVRVNGKWLTVETTNCKGKGVKGVRKLPSDHRVLTPVATVGRIFFNRGV